MTGKIEGGVIRFMGNVMVLLRQLNSASPPFLTRAGLFSGTAGF
jgi:hypothetical protein